MFSSTVFFGTGRSLIPVPASLFRFLVGRESASERARSRSKLTPDHHRVRDFVVLQVARSGEAVLPATIASELELPTARVRALLDELEAWKVFLYREGGEAVVWAYPGTAAQTPHYLKWSTGETSWAA